MKILVLNNGSSSLKISLFELSNDSRVLPNHQPIWQAQVDWRPEGKISLRIQNHHQDSAKTLTGGSRADITAALLQSLWTGDQSVISGPSEIGVIGHRVVHGGTLYTKSALVTTQVLADLQTLVELAPAHQPASIQGIEIAGQIIGGVPQIAVFDTSFHLTMPEAAIIYACPYDWYHKLGIRRFGFHGISHQFCAGQAATILQQDLSSLRLITCHLGSGASLCAIKDGKSQMTTMGFTPLEGLVMGSRSGSIDPGLILYLLNRDIYSAQELTTILNDESGIKGLSGLTSDMQELQHLAGAGNQRAQLAFDVYINHLASNITALLPSIGGLDVIAFTGGVGQNSSLVRASVCSKLKFMGVLIDAQKNSCCEQDTNISADAAAIKTLVIHSREDLAIASECIAFLE